MTQELAPSGNVFVHGEMCDATSTADQAVAGTKFRFVRADDMMLTVEPAESRSERS